MSSLLNNIVAKQLETLGDHDDSANAWKDTKASESWGGRGKGGRGLKRQTLQPKDINLSNISLDYDSRNLLERGELKFINGNRCYGLLGRNGSGKTTLLRAMNGKVIPGFPRALSSVLIPQEVLPDERDVSSFIRSFDGRIEKYEKLLEEEENPEEIERLCQLMADLDDTTDGEHGIDFALRTFSVEHLIDEPMEALSGGERKRVALAGAVLAKPDVLMLDEPVSKITLMLLILGCLYCGANYYSQTHRLNLICN